MKPRPLQIQITVDLASSNLTALIAFLTKVRDATKVVESREQKKP